MPDTFICFYCTSKEAKSERGQKTTQEDGRVKVLRIPDEGEKFSVKDTMLLDDGSVVLYLYKRPTKPVKPPNKQELKRRALE